MMSSYPGKHFRISPHITCVYIRFASLYRAMFQNFCTASFAHLAYSSRVSPCLEYCGYEGSFVSKRHQWPTYFPLNFQPIRRWSVHRVFKANKRNALALNRKRPIRSTCSETGRRYMQRAYPAYFLWLVICSVSFRQPDTKARGSHFRVGQLRSNHVIQEILSMNYVKVITVFLRYGTVAHR